MNAVSASAEIGHRLVAPFLELLPVTGAALSVLGQDHKASLLHASDGVAARLEEIHFDLGEGPMFDCFSTASPILVDDAASADRWPLFSAAADDVAAGGYFVFPLSMGAACVGAVLCYRTSAGGLDAGSVETGVALGRATAGPAFRQAILAAGDDDVGDDSPIEMRREVHQATGMVLQQLETTATEAFVRMRAYAFANGLSLRHVAHEVVARRFDFSALTD